MTVGLDVTIRPIRQGDAARVAAIERAHTRRLNARWWEDVIARHVRRGRGASRRVGFVAEEDGRVVGYILGQVRAFEFGSEPCGWIYSVGVHPGRLRRGIAALLFERAVAAFRDLGVSVVRTMVRNDDERLQTFFRSRGFVRGTYTELERPVEE